MNEFNIQTAQNVTINQNIAPVTTRIKAFLLDLLIIIGYYIIVFFTLNFLDFLDSENLTVILVVMGLPVFFYHLLFEVFMDGQTPGKYWTKSRVMMLDGSSPNLSNYIIRWILRIFDITLTSGSLALISLLFNGKGQRLGDIAAGTTVITDKNFDRLSDSLHEELDESYEPTFPQVSVLTDRDIQNIKLLYEEAKQKGNHSALLKLSIKIKELTGISTDMLPLNFIAVILKDYNYYTQTM